VLGLLVAGLTNAEIARRLYLAEDVAATAMPRSGSAPAIPDASRPRRQTVEIRMSVRPPGKAAVAAAVGPAIQ